MLTVQTSNPQAAYLGNDTLFRSSPPIDFADTDLGYVGCQNKMILKIPQGQIIADAKRGQIFLITANQAQDLSAFGSGMNRFFTDHLAFEILRFYPTVNTDNHFNNLGLHGVYDSKYDRIMISKLDYIPQPTKVDVIKYDEALQKFYVEHVLGGNILIEYIALTNREYFCNKSWTLSFNMNTKSWISFHSYIPNFYIAENNFFYSGLNEGCDLAAIAAVEIPTPATTTTTTTVLYCNLIGTAVDVTPIWVNQDINEYWRCVGVDQHYQQIDINPYSPTYNTTRVGALYQANSPICGYVPSDCTLTPGSAVLVTYDCTLTAGSAVLYDCTLTSGTVIRINNCALSGGTVIRCTCKQGTITNNNAFFYTDCAGVFFSGGAESGSEVCINISLPYSGNIGNFIDSVSCQCS